MKKLGSLIPAVILACAGAARAAGADGVPSPGKGAEVDPAGPPILYDAGAGGVTFSTPKDEVRRILGEPVDALPDFNVEYYSNGMWIAWNDGPNPTPYSMGIEEGYAGALRLPEPFGALRFGGVYDAMFTPEDPLGREVVRKLYRHFEGAGPDYDCFATDECGVRTPPIEKIIVWRLPHMGVLFHNKRHKTLMRIVLVAER